MNRMELHQEVREFPTSPGVYMMRDRSGETIYVGKTKNLKSRVGSYFSGKKDPKTEILMEKVREIETITTQNEYEALLLENTLIKKHNPKYNISLKDGKTYPVIRITNEPFPRIFKTRHIVHDGSSYYGPYPQVGAVDRYLEFISRIYPLRRCHGRLRKRSSPCLYYHIGRCSAPCAGKCSEEEYGRWVDEIRALLEGNFEELEEWVKIQMTGAAEALQFERAAELRDALEGLRRTTMKQGVVDFDDEKRDYVAYTRQESRYTFAVYQMREGRLIAHSLYRTSSPVGEEEAVSQFLYRFYSESSDPPTRLYLPIELEADLLREYFRCEHGRDVAIFLPGGEKGGSEILAMAKENAREDMRRRLTREERSELLKSVQEALSLPRVPRRIEGFDISHLGGKHTVASMVSFWNGESDRRNYRHFKLKSLSDEIDDYAAMREVVARRYTRILNEGGEAPDLILVDGGKGQVGVAREILDSLGYSRIPVVGLAKRLEEVYFPGSSEPVTLPEGCEPLRLLQAVRDEAHRFANTFNRKLRLSGIKAEKLQSIPGVGEVRSQRLMEKFGSIQGIVDAGVAEVASRGRVPKEVAVRIIQELMGVKDGSPLPAPQPPHTDDGGNC